MIETANWVSTRMFGPKYVLHSIETPDYYDYIKTKNTNNF